MSLAKPEVLREIHFLSSWQCFVMNATAALLELIGVSARVIKCVSSGSGEARLSHLEKVTFSHAHAHTPATLLKRLSAGDDSTQLRTL